MHSVSFLSFNSLKYIQTIQSEPDTGNQKLRLSQWGKPIDISLQPFRSFRLSTASFPKPWETKALCRRMRILKDLNTRQGLLLRQSLPVELLKPMSVEIPMVEAKDREGMVGD